MDTLTILKHQAERSRDYLEARREKHGEPGPDEAQAIRTFLEAQRAAWVAAGGAPGEFPGGDPGKPKARGRKGGRR